MTQKRACEIQERTKEAVEYPPSWLWTYAGLAAYCKVSERTIDRLVQDGQLKTIPIRGSRRIRHGDFLEFLSHSGDAT